MDFPIVSLIDDERAEQWLLNHFHPQGLNTVHCEASVEDALPDTETETDEMFQNAGEKGEPHKDPEDPPRPGGTSYLSRFNNECPCMKA